MTGARGRDSGDPRACLRAVVAGRDLSPAEAEALFERIMEGRVSPIMVGAILAALRTKGETAGEIVGAARVMRARAERVATARGPLVDTCGTGGDYAGTFNLSTTAAIVVAAAGVPVAKHGNRAASSRSGSADVLESLGVAIDLPPDLVGRCIDEIGIGFLFAPRFHPAMRHAIGARREIGIRTLFNLLGPLTNPAGARRQVVGVPTREAVPLVATVLRDLGAERALVVHGREGLDEISVAGPTDVARVEDGAVERGVVTPGELGLGTHDPAALAGGDAAENGRILRSILAGEGTPAQSAATAANAGAAIWAGGAAASLEEGVERAVAILREGAAMGTLDALIETTRGLAGEVDE